MGDFMNKIFKSRLFAFILGAIIFSGITVVASQLFASSVTYSPSDDTFKKSNGEDIETVADAIDELYIIANKEKYDKIEKLSISGTNTLNYGITPTKILIYCPAISGKTYDGFMVYYNTGSREIYLHSNTGGSDGLISINNNNISITVAGYVGGSDNAYCRVFASE